MDIACPLSHVGPLEAVVAGHQLAILVRDVVSLARLASLVTRDDSSQTILRHIWLFRAAVISTLEDVKDIL
jgi:hypothetical protein